jgi:hypothetical protein
MRCAAPVYPEWLGAEGEVFLLLFLQKKKGLFGLRGGVALAH